MKTAEEIIESHIGSKSWFGRGNSPLRQEFLDKIEIIGNIHDNG